jgi:hypothetical protein
MRTKTLILSALLGALGSVAVHAQTNVYSLNAVGYINVTLSPGFNIITDPLIASPNNNITTLFPNTNGAYDGDIVYFYNATLGAYTTDNASSRATNGTGWVKGGTNVLAPGVATWFVNSLASNVTVTFVGTVPSGPITNALLAGFNLVGSVVPTSGDIVSNTISALTNYNVGDDVYVFNPVTQVFNEFVSGTREHSGYNGNWNTNGDPTIANVYEGFFYLNTGATVNWVEDYSVSE